MALFPAFCSVSQDRSSNAHRVQSERPDLEWLNLGSYSNEDALSLHQRAIHRHTEDLHTGVQNDEDEDEDEEGFVLKKKKKKEKKKKKKKTQKSFIDGKSKRSSSDTAYPSDLLIQDQKPSQRSDECVNVGGVLWLDDLQNPAEGGFYIDRRSDPANWEYRSLYRAHISRYKRKGASVLGLDSRTQAVCWDVSTADRKRREKRDERYFSPSNRQALRIQAPPTLITVSSSGSTPGSFIPVPPCGEEPDYVPPADTPSDPLGVYDSATSLWNQGKGQPEVKGEVQSPGQHCPSGRVEEFNRKLREEPTDVALWLQFIKFQDELGSSLSAPQREWVESGSGRGSERGLWERKLSIVDRALESNPGSVELKLERLRFGRELWDGAALMKEWKKLIFVHPNSASLWKKYIQYTQSHFSSFSVSVVTGVYRKCLSTLSAVQDGQMMSHPVLPGTEENMLDIFVWQCHFLLQAGHSEKAVSLFQAQLEFTFFKPDSVRELSTKQQVEFFEPFWDSGEPRLGERGSRGWKTWMQQQEKGGWIQAPEPEEEEEDEDDGEIKDKTLPKWRIWLDVESWREAHHWLPWRPDKAPGQSEEDCDDPDRQVVFDDIGPSLIRVRTPDLRFHLLLSFLHFLGVPISSSSFSPLSDDQAAGLDNFALIDETLDHERPLTSHDVPLRASNTRGHVTRPCDSKSKLLGLCKQGEELLKNVLEKTLPLFPPEQSSVLTVCWFQYEKVKVFHSVCSGSKKGARVQGKCSKRMLKRLLKQQENRSSLALWREFAHIEWLLGNVNEGRHIFDSALSLSGVSGLTDPVLCSLSLLYAQLEVELMYKDRNERLETRPSNSRAVYILTSLTEGTTYRPFTGDIGATAILKARKAYEHGVSEWGTQPNSCALISCFGLFQYLTMGLDAADGVYSQARQSIKCTADCEAVCVQHVALLHHHSTVSSLPLRCLRLALTDALTLLPHSAPLWRLYLQADMRNYSGAHTRRFLHTVAKGNRNLIPALFTVATEQQRKRRVDLALRSGLPFQSLSIFPETGLGNRIRSLFEVAIVTECGARCPLLWRMYLKYMVCEGDVERARRIFYRALQNVPWVKVLYVDAVCFFPDHMQEFLDLLTEKDLRLRTPMEELDILLED